MRSRVRERRDAPDEVRAWQSQSEGPSLAPNWLSRILAACELLAVPMAVTRYCLLLLRAPSVLSWLGGCGHGCWWALRRISFGRLAHQILFRVARLVPVDAIERRIFVEDQGRVLTLPCLIALFHSPWNWALAPWLAVRQPALVAAGARWQAVLGASYVPLDRAGLATIARHLRSGGRAAILVDKFLGAGSCEVAFLNRRMYGSTAVAQLAAIGGVPLVPCVCAWRDGLFRLSVGPRIHVGRGPAQASSAMQELMAFFDHAIRNDPATCVFLSHLRSKNKTDGPSPRAPQPWEALPMAK